VGTLIDTVAELRPLLAEAGDPGDARAMAAYQKGVAPFFGVQSPERRRLQRTTWEGAPTPDGDTVVGYARACFAQPERELHYAGCDALRRWEPALEPRHLDDLRALVTTVPWWDTVDPLATHAVGGLVRRYRHLQAEMDRWVGEPDRWVARTALLHQLLWKQDTDAQRLFSYVRGRAADPDVFVRKACGWALRQYARTDPDAVRGFLADHGDRLSALTRREAARRL
jgi:3-methyladenine DNA glycosylase AlkD